VDVKTLPSAHTVIGVAHCEDTETVLFAMGHEQGDPPMSHTHSLHGPHGTTSSNELRLQLLHERYLCTNAQGRVAETPEEMFQRVADTVITVEQQYGTSPVEMRGFAAKCVQLMRSGRFLPNSPTLMNAGCRSGMLSACFVLGIADSVEGIFDTVKQTALIQKAGGGTGFALDTLRPTGDRVASTGGVTSGPLSFWRVIAETMTAIQQGAMRRGAGMAMMSVDHPDILSFIAAKQRPDQFTNFNISVKITGEFMSALESAPNTPHVVVNQRDGQRYLMPRSLALGEYSLDDLCAEDESHQACFTVSDVWDLIIRSAHATGEPGICFIDRVNQANPTPHIGCIHATNPCGEQPLLPGEACCLGSLNVSRFVVGEGMDLDWSAFADAVKTAVRFLDDVVDANAYPLTETQSITMGNRKTGLGIMGFADALVKMDLRYDSEQAVDLAENLARFLQETAHQASQELAEHRGSFPNWEGSIWDTEHGRPMRNASCTTIAPTGSLSILAGWSAGIEPIYSLAYLRRAMDGREFIHVHPLLEEIGITDRWMTDAVRQALLEGAAPTDVPSIPGALAETLVTAHCIAPEWHVRMQAAFQEHIDNAVSKTVNLPADATVEDIDRIYRLAYQSGCKGTTVYRDQCRQGQTLTRTLPDAVSTVSPSALPRPRGRVTEGRTVKFRMGCGTLFVTVNQDENGLCEVFANLGKAGGCPSQTEATCRIVSAALRSRVNPDVLVEQLKGIRCLSTCVARNGNQDVDVLSCPDAIARAIEEAMLPSAGRLDGAPDRRCPDCGSLLRKQEGCLVCSCGYSKCF